MVIRKKSTSRGPYRPHWLDWVGFTVAKIISPAFRDYVYRQVLNKPGETSVCGVVRISMLLKRIYAGLKSMSTYRKGIFGVDITISEGSCVKLRWNLLFLAFEHGATSS